MKKTRSASQDKVVKYAGRRKWTITQRGRTLATHVTRGSTPEDVALWYDWFKANWD